MHLNPSFLIVLLTLVWMSPASVSGLTDPFNAIKGQSYDVNVGCKDIPFGGMGYIYSGAYLGYKNVSFSQAAVALQLRVSFFNAVYPGRRILLRLDSPTSTPFLVYDNFYPTLGWNDVITVTQLIPADKQPSAVHDLYFTFEATELDHYIVDFYSFTFVASGDYCPEHNSVLPTLCVNRDTINYSSATKCTTVECTTCTALDQ